MRLAFLHDGIALGTFQLHNLYRHIAISRNGRSTPLILIEIGHNAAFVIVPDELCATGTAKQSYHNHTEAQPNDCRHLMPPLSRQHESIPPHDLLALSPSHELQKFRCAVLIGRTLQDNGALL